MLWVRISMRAKWPTLYDKVCQWLTTGRWFSSGPPVSSTNKTDCYNVTEILLKVVLDIIKQTRNNMNVSEQGRLSNFTFMHQLNFIGFRQSWKFPPPNKMAELTLCLWEEMGLVWPGWLKKKQSLYCCSIFHNYNMAFNNDHNSYHKMTVWNCS